MIGPFYFAFSNRTFVLFAKMAKINPGIRIIPEFTTNPQGIPEKSAMIPKSGEPKTSPTSPKVLFVAKAMAC